MADELNVDWTLAVKSVSVLLLLMHVTILMQDFSCVASVVTSHDLV